jgi:DNA-binding NarL/FixJ family response regulator
LTPVFGSFEELLSDPALLYVFMDLKAYSKGVETMETIRRRRPDMRLIVLGPEGDDELVLCSIMAGARAYLDLKASPRIVRQAFDVVTSGSIWAPRRLLSLLIDRLLATPDTSLTSAPPHLTDRESQVLELIITATPNREIARQLGIEESTVQAHVGRLLRKTGAENRIGLIMHASNPALLEAAGFRERRRVDRRQGDRRQ